MEREILTNQSLWAMVATQKRHTADDVAEGTPPLHLPRQLGKILLDEGLLSVRQLMEIVGSQLDRPRLRLGELAVAAGLCTEADIERCLHIQKEESRRAVESFLGGADHRVLGLVRALYERVRTLEDKVERAASGVASAALEPVPA